MQAVGTQDPQLEKLLCSTVYGGCLGNALIGYMSHDSFFSTNESQMGFSSKYSFIGQVRFDQTDSGNSASCRGWEKLLLRLGC